MFYDKFRNFFYRVFVHKPDTIVDFKLNSTNSERNNQYYGRKFSIIIYDEKFNKLNEVVMEPGKYDFKRIKIIPQGILLMHQKEDGKLKFDLFKVGG